MQSTNLDSQISNYLSNSFSDDQHFFSSKLAILDTIGCIIEASSHKDVLAYANILSNNKLTNNPFNSFNEQSTYQEISWFLTVLTRWFDYNDTFLAKEWAHPSDNFGSIYSYFYKNQEHNLFEFTSALTKAYEIQGSMCLGTSLNKLGFDHVFYVKLATGSVFSYLLNRSEEIVKKTINQILLDGPSLRSYRHYPNVGKRKSWAAADASKRGIELAQISELDDVVYSTIQNDSKWGFEKNYLNDLKLEFGKPLNDWVIQNVLFKVLFPAEFHGQSAVECAIKLSKEFNNNKEKIKQIKIFTHEPAIRIIANKEKLQNASDRDHSLEYMVAAALLFGNLEYEMYESNFSGIDQIEQVRKLISVEENESFTDNYYNFSKRHISNSLKLEYVDGKVSELVTIDNPIGHPSRREEAIPLIKEKFVNNTKHLYTENKSYEIWDKIIELDKNTKISVFLNIFSENE